MRNAQRKSEEAWEAVKDLGWDDPNYSSAMQRFLDASKESCKEINRELKKIGRDKEKISREMEAENEELKIEVEELKAQTPADNHMTEEDMKEISS